MALGTFIGVGMIAFLRLNIEAYPNPAPVILEITAQYAGQSAEEMERYYTIPMEVGLAATPGVDSVRSTSFYGLSFVRVTFRYGIEYYFALQQAALSLQQNVSLPNGVSAQIQGSSLVGEIFRYQLKGPEHYGLTNLRTIQDWVLQRRLDTEAPDAWTAPTGTRCAIDYAAEGGPRIEVRVQELFGLGVHPAIAQGRVPLTLSLLSPARRPIQTTRDLPGFWRGSWAEVRKDMRGRYPKHPWPEDPLAAPPTTRVKPRP